MLVPLLRVFGSYKHLKCRGVSGTDIIGTSNFAFQVFTTSSPSKKIIIIIIRHLAPTRKRIKKEEKLYLHVPISDTQKGFVIFQMDFSLHIVNY